MIPAPVRRDHARPVDAGVDAHGTADGAAAENGGVVSVMSGIRERANRRGITRLCHFTPSRNLAHIASDSSGLLASRHLQDDEAAIFNPTDRLRLDGYPGHVCCSIQYPNAWYFRKARENERLFPDWVVLLIDVRYLWQAGTKFCPRNAAAEHGRLVQEGVKAFDALFADVVEGVDVYRRGPRHPDFLPTDEQAEVPDSRPDQPVRRPGCRRAGRRATGARSVEAGASGPAGTSDGDRAGVLRSSRSEQ